MLSLPGKPGWQWEVAEFKWAHATDPSTCGLDTRCIPIRKYFIGSPHATGVYIYICIYTYIYIYAERDGDIE